MATDFDIFNCARKRKYEKRAQAYAALEAMMVKYSAKEIARLGVYRCTVCGNWHLGNSKRRKAWLPKKRISCS